MIRGIWYSVFHSISAFCNAGIDILGSGSFTKYAGNPLINITTMLLIILGGLGFTVWFDVIGNRILMSKYAGRAYKKYALLAGFTEIGETVEETVAREVMEEVGLKVRNIRYYKSQPWAFSDTLLMGFYCDLDGSDKITLDRDELSLAEWFEREEIPVEPSRDSLTNEMIMKFKQGEV